MYTERPEHGALMMQHCTWCPAKDKDLIKQRNWLPKINARVHFVRTKDIANCIYTNIVSLA